MQAIINTSLEYSFMGFVNSIRQLLMQLIGQPRKESEKEIHERIIKKRKEAYAELAKY